MGDDDLFFITRSNNAEGVSFSLDPSSSNWKSEIAMGRLRRNGLVSLSAPYSRETDAMASSSVLTTTRVTRALAWAAKMLRATRGVPPTSLRFLPGIPLDPPRAGIKARTESSDWCIGADRCDRRGFDGLCPTPAAIDDHP